MLAALAAGRPGAVAVLLGGSAWAIFLAHEPLLVLLGRRGERMQSEQRPRATARLVMLGVTGTILGIAGLALAPPPVRAALVLPGVLGAAFAGTLALGQERSLVAEGLAALALAAVSLPLGLASGLSLDETARAWCVWALGFGALLVPVRSIGARRRASTSLLTRLFPVLLAFATALWLMRVGFTPGNLLALAPLLLSAAWFGVAPPPARSLPRVGWTVVCAGLLTTAMLILFSRARSA